MARAMLATGLSSEGERGSPAIRALVEIHLRGRADPVRALAEEDPVQVQGQDLLLAELPLEPQGEEGLLELAPQRALVAEHGVARELHGDRAAALAHATRGQVAHRGAHDALPVHARVLEEAVVLGREERVHQQRRDLVPLHRDAPLLADERHELAVARVDGERHLRAHVAQLGRVGDLRLEELVRAGEAECHESGDRQHNRERGHEHSRRDIACAQN